MSAAVMAAVNCVALTKVVVRAPAFHRTTEVVRKFVPVTVRLKAGPPAMAVEGDNPLSVGTGALITNDTGEETTPELETVTCAVPGLAMSAAVMAAVNRVVPVNAVSRGLPFHSTVELVTKLLPLTVKVNAAPPAVAVAGDKELITGIVAAWTFNVTEALLTPPVVTKTDTVPGEVEAGTCTVTWYTPTNIPSAPTLVGINCEACTCATTPPIVTDGVAVVIEGVPDAALPVGGWFVTGPSPTQNMRMTSPCDAGRPASTPLLSEWRKIPAVPILVKIPGFTPRLTVTGALVPAAVLTVNVAVCCPANSQGT